ncbi:MAG: glutamine--fructose-6-phosphate transaminase (isomerizing) [Chloroflexi bacterium]|nr:glutamine--fructose-6-phosphate transaminase (isomerizing) [Chloroflexota bacterium]
MCGIVGYTGPRDATPILLDGLRRLEYRGYDSAGIAILQADGIIAIRKNEGKLQKLVDNLNGSAPRGTLGLGHTRWATHGAPNDTNAHPHTDCAGRIAVVHNGIIENYAELREDLRAQGHKFATETDTEVLAHLIEEELQALSPQGRGQVRGDTNPHPSPLPQREKGQALALTSAVQRALKKVRGTYGIGVIDLQNPELLIGARHFSPLIVGIGDGENFIASDIPALLPHTKRVLLIEDGEIAALTREAVHLYTLDGVEVEREPFEVNWDVQAAEKGGYPHFFLKEIHEQPAALANALRGRVDERGAHLDELDALDLARVNRVLLLACGSSFNAGLIGKRVIEEWVRVPAEAIIASEFRYASPVIDDRTLAILITQSGETADTLASMRLAKSAGAQTLALTNTIGSSITRGATAVVNLHVGPEIGVVASKTFSAQALLLELIALDWAQRRGTLDAARVAEIARQMAELPDRVEAAMGLDHQMRALAEKIWTRRSIFFFGRGFGYPTALEGALKLKEISYLHAEGYPAGELKHGPIAMLDPEIPVIAIATHSAALDKVVSNIQEVRARSAPVIALTTEGDASTGAQHIAQLAQDVIYLPRVAEEFAPVVAVVPLQLLAYYVALKRGCDVDQPRNLAKSVTVE